MSHKRRADADGASATKAQRLCAGFDSLPLDIAKWILSFLTDTKDVLAARSVCKQWDCIAMNPRPVVAHIQCPRDFVRLVKALSVYNEETMSFSLSNDSLFTAISTQRECAEATFGVENVGFVGDVDFLLPLCPLTELLKRIERTREDCHEGIRIALFERVSRVAVVFSGAKERRLTAELVTGLADWDRLCDFDYRFQIPFNVAMVASMKWGLYNDVALVTVRTAPTPEYLRLRLCGELLDKRLVVFTLNCGNGNPELNYHFIEHVAHEEKQWLVNGHIKDEDEDGEDHALLRFGSEHIDKYARVEFQPLFEVKVEFALLWKACGVLHEIRDVTLCVPTCGEIKQVPIILERDKGVYKIKWAIAPLSED